MTLMPCQFKLDCGSALLTNYSSEGAEPFPPYWSLVFPDPTNNPIDGEWSRLGCVYLYVSYVSQEDADLGALRQSVLCTTPPGEEIWYSAEATCTTACPDGSSSFTYIVPAGTFIAETYAAALAQAQQYACEQAVQERICLNTDNPPNRGNTTLGNLPRCACLGVAYSGTIQANGAVGNQTWSVVGAIPPGLIFTPAGTGAIISGIPTVNGTYAFQVFATGSNGSYATRTFTISVLEITTNALPNFTIGTPYSLQMKADGGSGNYIWSIATGTLPAGLSMSLTGLISGTPTALAIGDTLTFVVTDVTC